MLNNILFDNRIFLMKKNSDLLWTSKHLQLPLWLNKGRGATVPAAVASAPAANSSAVASVSLELSALDHNLAWPFALAIVFALLDRP
jgi:hypothetical protein